MASAGRLNHCLLRISLTELDTTGGGVPKVLEGQCVKKDIIGYLPEIDEEEIIIDPTRVFNKRLIQVGSNWDN